MLSRRVHCLSFAAVFVLSGLAASLARCQSRPAEKAVEEMWDALSMQGKRIGYSQTTIANVTENGRELVRTRNFLHTAMQRAGLSLDEFSGTTAGRLDRAMAGGAGIVESLYAIARAKVVFYQRR